MYVLKIKLNIIIHVLLNSTLIIQHAGGSLPLRVDLLIFYKI